MMKREVPEIQGLEKIASWKEANEQAAIYLNKSFFSKKRRIISNAELIEAKKYLEEFYSFFAAMKAYNKLYSKILDFRKEQNRQISKFENIFGNPQKKKKNNDNKETSLAIQHLYNHNDFYLNRINNYCNKKIISLNKKVSDLETKKELEEDLAKKIANKMYEINQGVQEINNQTNIFKNVFACEIVLDELKELGNKYLFEKTSKNGSEIVFHSWLENPLKRFEKVYEFGKDKEAIKLKYEPEWNEIHGLTEVSVRRR